MLQLSQRPLSGSDADTALFVDRERELDAILRGSRLDFNVLVLGERGSGRSSLLRQVARRLGDAPTRTLDAQPFSHPRDLVLAAAAVFGVDQRPDQVLRRRERISAVAQSVVNMGGARVETYEEPVLHDGHLRALGIAVEEFLEEDQIGGTAQATLLLDGVSAQVAGTLFGRFRDTLWDLPVRWIVTGDLGDRDRYLRPPADAFFDTVVTLPPLTIPSAAELLRRRIHAAGADSDAARLEPVVSQLVASVPVVTPRAVLAAARALVIDDRTPGDVFRARAQQEAAAAALGRPEMGMFIELQTLGPVHMGNPELLSRLGITRQRAVEIANRLEREGLLQARWEGKRKVFEVASIQERR